jgi:hypothetical protein
MMKKMQQKPDDGSTHSGNTAAYDGLSTGGSSRSAA